MESRLTESGSCKGLKKRINPGDEISIAKHFFTVEYDPTELGAYGTPPKTSNWTTLSAIAAGAGWTAKEKRKPLGRAAYLFSNRISPELANPEAAARAHACNEIDAFPFVGEALESCRNLLVKCII